MSQFLADPADWAALAAVIRDLGVCGWDTETYGHNVKESTPAFRAKIDEWSLAVRTDSPHPMGYRRARGWALPLAALLGGPLRAVLEDQGVVKVAHNARHDLHAAENYGVVVRGIRDTLETARLAYPHLREYNLKALRVTVLGKSGRDTFADLTRPLEVPETSVIRRCLCGVKGCRKSKAPHKLEDVTVTKVRKVPCPIESIVPGHPRRAAKEQYMVDDAEDGLELDEVLTTRLAALGRALPELPW